MGAHFSSTAQEVVPGLYIGNVRAAQDRDQLRRLGVTHVVDVSAYDYRPVPGIVYLRLPIPDVPEFDIRTVLGATNGFLRTALRPGAGGRVLVHCMVGRSRSASVVLAYMMAFHRLTYDEALGHLQRARPIVKPNHGFDAQLRAYERELDRFRRTSPSDPDL